MNEVWVSNNNANYVYLANKYEKLWHVHDEKLPSKCGKRWNWKTRVGNRNGRRWLTKSVAIAWENRVSNVSLRSLFFRFQYSRRSHALSLVACVLSLLFIKVTRITTFMLPWMEVAESKIEFDITYYYDWVTVFDAMRETNKRRRQNAERERERKLEENWKKIYHGRLYFLIIMLLASHATPLAYQDNVVVVVVAFVFENILSRTIFTFRCVAQRST